MGPGLWVAGCIVHACMYVPSHKVNLSFNACAYACSVGGGGRGKEIQGRFSRVRFFFPIKLLTEMLTGRRVSEKCLLFFFGFTYVCVSKTISIKGKLDFDS